MFERAFVILAGGVGRRFNDPKPKQLSMLGGRSILEYTLRNISSYAQLNQIIVVAHHSILDTVETIVSNLGDPRINVVLGGENRLASTQRGIDAVVGSQATKVLIHDAVRPFIKHSVIEQCWEALEHYNGVDVVLPATDTIVQSDPQGRTIAAIPDRAQHFQGQTPQGFILSKIQDVYAQIGDIEAASFTDDCGMYLSVFPEDKIGLVQGHRENLKITYPIDLFIAEQLIKAGLDKDYTLTHTTPHTIEKMTIVILGGTSGLGLDASRRLQEMGAEVFVGSRTQGCDVTQPTDVQRFLETIHAQTGQIDVVINSSGLLSIGRLDEMSQGDIEQAVQTNHLGALNVAKAAYPFLRASKGQLILFSSSSYFRGRAGYAAYSSSKSAIVNMTQALAEEWMDDDIRVNCIVPRRANTPMRRRAFPDEDPSTLLDPSDVTDVIIKSVTADHSGIIHNVY